jgi:hypothetical protein
MQQQNNELNTLAYLDDPPTVFAASSDIFIVVLFSQSKLLPLQYMELIFYSLYIILCNGHLLR